MESAEAQALAAEESLNSMRISLMKQVANGYLCLIMLDEQLKIAHDAVASYRESLTLFENQLEGGVADLLQTASAQAALSAAEAQIPNLEMQIAELENTLSVLAGRAPGPIARGGNMMAFANASGVAAGIPADVIARRRISAQPMRKSVWPLPTISPASASPGWPVLPPPTCATACPEVMMAGVSVPT